MMWYIRWKVAGWLIRIAIMIMPDSGVRDLFVTELGRIGDKIVEALK